MTIDRTQVALPTGVSLSMLGGGPADAPALLFLHGFPESARTWRHQLADLARDHRVVAPDQRGFAGSTKPADVADYAIETLVADVIALADALDLGRFTLIGHDWGGAVAWAVALAHPDRVARLVIANAPHPYIFQKSLIDDPAQRAASQYMTMLRQPETAANIRLMGLDAFFDRLLAPTVPPGTLTPDDREAYLGEWAQPGALEGMTAWYKASQIVVPAPGEACDPPAWLARPFPPTQMPVLVIWGMRDTALLPVQLVGLNALVPDLTIVEVAAGHFVTWEAPDAVTAAIRAFLHAPAEKDAVEAS